MKSIKPIILSAVAVACMSSFGYAAAHSTDVTDAGALPEETVQGQVTYLTGGIGKDEADAVKHAESKYPLALEFSQRAKPKDEFIADVNVSITDKHGNSVLETSSAGPFLLANMPDGKYTVKAEENGKTIVRHVTLAAGKAERVSMVW